MDETSFHPGEVVVDEPPIRPERRPRSPRQHREPERQHGAISACGGTGGFVQAPEFGEHGGGVVVHRGVVEVHEIIVTKGCLTLEMTSEAGRGVSPPGGRRSRCQAGLPLWARMRSIGMPACDFAVHLHGTGRRVFLIAACFFSH